MGTSWEHSPKMRRHNSTKSTSGLSRSKSTKSTCSFRSAIERLEHIDPAIADRDAHLAATLSFSRSGPTPGTSASAYISGRSLRGSRLEHSGDIENSCDTTTGGNYDGTGVRRQKSVRFARPNHRLDTGRTAPFVSSYTTNYIESLPRVETYLPAEQPSAPSSTPRKLRKSRSMVTPTAEHQSLRAPKSMSFLKTGTMNPQPGVRTPHSLRKPSTNTPTVTKNGTLRKKARKVSNGLRTKFKSFFRRSKTAAGEDEGRAVEAGGPAEEDDEYMDIVDPVPDRCLMSQVPSRVPSLHNASSAQRLRSRQGSIESIDGGRKTSDDKLRVTSWTNSDTHTLNSQGTWGEKEKQRLSVIKEIGPHVSSSSFRRPVLNERNRYEFEAPSPQQEEASTAIVPTVDGQRVFSALMSRLSEVKEKENLRRQALRQTSVDDMRTIRCVQPEDDIFQDSQPELLPETRHGDAREDKSMSSSGSVIHHPQRSASGSIQYKAYPEPTVGDEKENIPIMAPVSKGDATAAPKTLSNRRSAFFGSPTCHLFRTTSPYRRALQKSVQENSEVSTQIQSPTLSEMLPTMNLDLITTRRHPSLSVEDPRLTYSDSIYSDQYLSPKSSPPTLGKIVNGSLRTRNSTLGSSGKQRSLAYSKSFDRLPSEHDSDTNTISSTRHARSGAHTEPREPSIYKVARSTDHLRTPSYASSFEWKTYLSANMSKADLHAPSVVKDLDEVRYVKPSLPKSRHVREGAHIDDDSPVLYGPPDLERAGKYHTPLRTTSHNRQSSSASRVEIGHPAKYSNSRGDENTIPYSDGRVSGRVRGMYGPPPIPPRSSLRTVPSMPVLQTRSTQSNIPVKSPKRNLRGMDTLVEAKPAETQQKPKTRSPMKLVRRAGIRHGIKPSASSPGLAMTVERQFGPILSNEQTERGSPRERWQNTSEHRLLDSSDSPDFSDTTGSDDWRAQKVGSQQMVDNFLSGKRRLPRRRSEEARIFL